MTKNKKMLLLQRKKKEAMPKPIKQEELDPIGEAKRYVKNARALLLNNGKLDTKDRIYGDSKYVRMAGNTLWNGCLIALEGVFKLKDKKDENSRVGIKDYQQAAVNRDKKLLNFVNSGYEVMHLYMGYDGNQSKDICDGGIQMANNIIDRCAILYKA